MNPLEAALSKIREDTPRRIGGDVIELDYDPQQVRKEIVAYYGYPEGPNAYRAEMQGDKHEERVYFIPADQIQLLGGGNTPAAAIARGLKKQGYLLTPDKRTPCFRLCPELRTSSITAHAAPFSMTVRQNNRMRHDRLR